jgi:hypothetical protein
MHLAQSKIAFHPLATCLLGRCSFEMHQLLHDHILFTKTSDFKLG